MGNLAREHRCLGSGRMTGGRVRYLVTLGKWLIGAVNFCSAACRLQAGSKGISFLAGMKKQGRSILPVF